ncbi:hypothetical protein MRB56_22675 [Halomonas cupida]|uniref:Uncharacterized protein n=1 Tax=Halomonas cupida TaxID=44933 RepID=A0A1M7FTV3_9GAMM|nr:hypothetical protein [Halomonas cupida]SHM07345.1 hypothetical protein SAMN05660971_02065 [Halomonas cupida]
MPSWLDYCFEYETVAVRSANNDNIYRLPDLSLVTVVRIQGDAPSRRRISSMDAATCFDGGGHYWSPPSHIRTYALCKA